MADFKVLQAVATALRNNPVPDTAKSSTPEQASSVIKAIEASPDLALAPIKSPWKSKINWGVVVGFAASIGALFGLPPETAPTAMGVINGAMALYVIITKTFFTKEITATSAGKV